jgi:Bacterial transcriptional repressor
MHGLLDGLSRNGAVRLTGAEAAPLATSMVVVVTYWLSFEYVRDPRHALEPEAAAAAMGRGAWHALALLLPHLDAPSRAHLNQLAAAYVSA